MSLHKLQKHMMGYLLDSADNKPSTHLTELQSMVASGSPSEGLQIYSHAYSSRLIEVLASDHEKLKLFLGAQDFNQLAAHYVVDHPSRVRSLRHYGHHFPEFLQASTHPQAARAAQLCAFERLLLDVYDSAKGKQLQHAQLTRLAPELWPSLTLSAHPSLRLFNDNNSAIPCWQICNQDHAQDWPADDNPPSTWLLWRDRSRVCQFRHLDHIELVAINAMLIGKQSLAEVAEQMGRHLPAEQLAPTLQRILSTWFTDGLVSQIHSD